MRFNRWQPGAVASKRVQSERPIRRDAKKLQLLSRMLCSRHDTEEQAAELQATFLNQKRSRRLTARKATGAVAFVADA
jgi:hypothetical protein